MSRDHRYDSQKPNLPNAMPLLRFKVVQFVSGPAYPVGNRVTETRDHRGGHARPTGGDSGVLDFVEHLLGALLGNLLPLAGTRSVSRLRSGPSFS